MSPTYTRYITRDCSFGNTLSLLQDLLNERLNSDFTKIWVQGSNSGKVRICFTLFNKAGYEMRFLELKNFRKFKSDAENIDEQINHIEGFITSLSTDILSDVF